MNALAEIQCADGWALVHQPIFPYSAVGESRETPFDWKNYGMYGFFAGMRNLSHSTVLSEPRGIPVDISEAAAAKIIDGASPANSADWYAPEQFSLVEQIEGAAGFSRLLKKEIPSHKRAKTPLTTAVDCLEFKQNHAFCSDFRQFLPTF